MAEVGEASFSPTSVTRKPVVVRVKRKASQEPIDALWLEINERPLKRALLDLSSLSIGESAGQEASRSKKVLVQHVDTISGSEASKDALLAFLDSIPQSSDLVEFKRKNEERRSMFKQDRWWSQKQDRTLLVARKKHEDLARNARFEQIWKYRREHMGTADDYLQEICHLYDVIRVDKEEMPEKSSEKDDVSIEDNAILCNYLPLLREFLPTAADEIESDLSSLQAKEENYVYDLYAVDDDSSQNVNDALTNYPLVQVEDDDDYYDGPPQSEFETDDSNAEDNPLNEYPDEESSIGENERDPLDHYSDLDSEYDKEIIYTDKEFDDYWKWEHR